MFIENISVFVLGKVETENVPARRKISLRKMLSCSCLNIIIESETNDFQQVTTDLLNLTEEEKQDTFFKQEIKQVDKLSRISKEHSGLVVSRNIGKWIVHQCLNCDVHSHAIHRDRGAACVLVSTKLLINPSVSTLRSSDLYSNIFNILVPTEKEGGSEKQPENLPPDVQLALGGLKQRVTEVLNREVAATEERVRHFTEQQYAALEKFREKARKEHKVLTRIILEKRYQPQSLSTNYNSMPSPPHSRLSIDNVPVLTANTNSPSDKPKNKLVSKMKSNPNRSAVRQMSTPLTYGNSIDSEGLFQLEEMEDFHQLSSSDHEDSDNEETARGETGHLTRSKSQPANVAKSLPVNIPVFMSPFRSRGDTDDEHDDILLHEDEHPSDIAASIKALAKSVHGDTVFGDLPRPRFSTQI